MKYFIPLIVTFISITLSAQAPNQFKYQTVIRDSNGSVKASETVTLKVDILEGSVDGSSVFTETHQVTTSSSGLVSISVGSINNLNVDWSSGNYFLQISIDDDVIGAGQILSVPYALHSETANTALSADFEKLTNAPDFSKWDKNVDDDFDGEYSSLKNAPKLFSGVYDSLKNKPTTITEAQAAKVDLLTVTAATDLDQLRSDVATNNDKQGFPGFGTTPGTALEGNNEIWVESEGDIYYDGNVGVNVASGTDFQGSALRVNGAVLYEGVPQTTTAGMLYYDPDGNSQNGSFKFYDNTGTLQELGSGDLTFTGDAFSQINSSDFLSNGDVLVRGSLGVGVDITDGETFGFSTVILKENNLRILFDDSDEPGGTAPANDWQLIANDNQNGGDSYFAIKDESNGTIPFRIDASAADNSFFIASGGNVGINTSTPSSTLEVNGTIKAASFIGDGSGLTGITGGTGGISNDDDTVIAADANTDDTGEIALQTRNLNRMVITNGGNVGIGTESPSTLLDVNGDLNADDLTVGGNLTVTGDILQNVEANSTTNSTGLDLDVVSKGVITFNSSAGNITLTGFQSGVTGQEVTIINIGLNSVIINHNGTGTQKIFNPQSININLSQNNSAKFIYTGAEWYCVSLSNSNSQQP
ncbi:MAG: hypothetical protein RJQ09_12425 [Cyclobacteriaceae bacterium]